MGLVIDLLKGALMHEHLWTDILPYGTFPSALTINGNLTVNGNLIQSNSISVSDTSIDDNIILLNNGETGAGVTSIESGVNIDRGTLNDAYLTFNETDDLWHYGILGGIDYIISNTSHNHSGVYEPLDSNLHIEQIGININGQGGVIAPGQYGGYFRVLYSGTITGWNINEGSAVPVNTTTVIDVWKSPTFYPTVNNTIFGTKPSLTASTNNSTTGLNIGVTAGDWFAYNVDSNDNALILNFNLQIEKS